MTKKIKIAYFDLGFSKEQYGLKPTKYGGGAVAARYLKEEKDIDFHIFAPAESFSNLSDDESGCNCFAVEEKVLDYLKNGVPIDAIDYFRNNTYDIFLHPHSYFTLDFYLTKDSLL